MAAPLKRTPLSSFHAAHGAIMGSFADWSMPFRYSKMGSIKEHIHTRNEVSLFDLSHLRQIRFFGPDRETFLEWTSVVDFQTFGPSHGKYTLIPTEQGTIVDDCIVWRHEDHCYMVLNARDADRHVAMLHERLSSFGGDVRMSEETAWGLLALQGPRASAVLERHLTSANGSVPIMDLSHVTFMTSIDARIGDVPVRVMRCGYSGEDGFELSIENAAEVETVASTFCPPPGESKFNTSTSNNAGEPPRVQMAGLSARNTLRLEAGLCLGGHELDETVNPVMAGLGFTMSRRRIREGGFIGHGAIARMMADPSSVPMRRVGLISRGRTTFEGTMIGTAVPTDGTDSAPATSANLEAKDPGGDEVVERVTSGCQSPTLQCNVAQAYVACSHAKPGTRVTFTGMEIRTPSGGHEPYIGEIKSLPLVPTQYYRVPNVRGK